MSFDNIAVTVREGDTFDELQLNIEKPWGTPHNYSNSVLVADIRRFFNDSTDPVSAVDSWGIVETDPTQGKLSLRLSSRQTEALGRNTPLGSANLKTPPSLAPCDPQCHAHWRCQHPRSQDLSLAALDA